MNPLDIISALELERDKAYTTFKSIEDTIIALKKTYGLPPSNGHTIGNKKETNGTLTLPLHLTPAYSGDSGKYQAYFSAKTNRDKVIAILRAEGKFLHVRQFIKIAQQLQPNMNPEKLAKQIQFAVYGLKNMDNSPIVAIAINKSNINTFWGSRNWVNEKGEIKPEFMYDEDQIKVNKGEVIEI